MSLWLSPLLALQTTLLAPSVYLAFLTITGLFYRQNDQAEALPPQYRLAVLVPAHNEERLLPGLLQSLQGGSSPSTQYQVFVVADNCSDATAAVARGHGATVFERTDQVRVGKGYALEWLLECIGATLSSFDAVVFLDADCTVSPNFLEALARRLAAGNRAVQAYYTSAQPFETSVSALRFAALVLKHYTRQRGRGVLGLPCGLFGTGMAFSREVIQTYGWSAFTLAEDIEYQLQLAEDGIFVRFASEATVLSQMPSSLRGAKSQNLRWEQGRLQMALRRGPRLLRDALRRRSWKPVDIFIEQALPPLSVLAALSAAMVPITLLTGNPAALALALTTIAALTVHVWVGLVAARVPVRTYRAFLFAPPYVGWKLFIYVLALLTRTPGWVRTERP